MLTHGSFFNFNLLYIFAEIKDGFTLHMLKTMKFTIKNRCTQSESSFTLKLVSVSVTCLGITLMRTVAEAADRDGNGLV